MNIIRQFFSDDMYDWFGDHVKRRKGMPVPLRWVFRVIILAALGWSLALLTAKALHAQGPDSAKVEGLSVRFAWPSLSGADSARLTITDLKTGRSYFNQRVSTRTKTRAVTIPVRIENGLTSYREVRRVLAVTRDGVTSVDTILFPRVASVVINPPVTPPDTVVPAPPDTGVVIGDYIPDPSSIAELPRVWLDSRMPESTRSVPVTCSTLQAALNAAVDGDKLTLPADAECVGHYTYSGKRTNVILTTATPLPAEGVRVTPETARHFAALIASNSQPALDVKAFASGLRLVGLQFRSADATKLTYMLVSLGPVVHSLDSLAHDLTLDRVYMQGHDSLQLQRCVAANAARVVIVNSWLAGCHYKGSDAQAVIAWNSPGPFKIVNNYLEGSGENVLFGGADPAIPGLIASDIEFRQNWLRKPDAWRDSTGFNPWTEKLLFELKSARRVLIEANVFENNWVDAQTGYAIWFKSANQSGHCDWCGTSDVIIRYNQIRNTTAGIAVTRGEAYNGGTFDPVHRVDIHDILMDSVGTSGPTTARRLLYFAGPMVGFSASHITSIDGGNYHAVTLAGVFDGGVIRDNLLTTGNYGVLCDGKGFGTAALTNCFPTGTFTGNVLVGKAYSLSTFAVPTGNTYPGALPYTGPAGVDRAALMQRLQGVAP